MKHLRFTRLWPIAVLLVLFSISVVLRLPAFSVDPIKSQGYSLFQRFNNNEVYIHDEYTLSIYQHYPAREHLFAGYIPDTQHYLAHKTLPTGVYTSFPPTHFIVLYVILKIFHAAFNFTALQIFSLSLHLLCVLLLYYLCRLLGARKWLAVCGASMYIFSTGTLQYHMNVYWAHELLQPVFIASLVVFVRRRGLIKWWHALMFGFALSIITWTGAVAVGGYALYGAYQYHKTKQSAYGAYIWMIAGGAIALALIAAQALIATGASPQAYLMAISHRVQARSPTAGDATIPILLWRFVNDVLLDYGGYMLIAYTLAIKQKLQGFAWGILWVASFPLLESIPLLEHDQIYGFARLKWIIPVIIAICLLGKTYATTKKRALWLGAAITAANIGHALLYLVVYQVQ